MHAHMCVRTCACVPPSLSTVCTEAGSLTGPSASLASQLALGMVHLFHAAPPALLVSGDLCSLSPMLVLLPTELCPQPQICSEKYDLIVPTILGKKDFCYRERSLRSPTWVAFIAAVSGYPPLGFIS